MGTNAWYLRYMTLRAIVDETVVSYEVATTNTIAVTILCYTSKVTHFFSFTPKITSFYFQSYAHPLA